MSPASRASERCRGRSDYFFVGVCGRAVGVGVMNMLGACVSLLWAWACVGAAMTNSTSNDTTVLTAPWQASLVDPAFLTIVRQVLTSDQMRDKSE